MLQLILTAEERDVLRDALKNYISNLIFEIGDTDDRVYREMLKRRERVLEHVMEQLGVTGEPFSQTDTEVRPAPSDSKQIKIAK